MDAKSSDLGNLYYSYIIAGQIASSKSGPGAYQSSRHGHLFGETAYVFMRPRSSCAPITSSFSVKAASAI